MIQLVTLAPGHFHAALIQKEMIDGVDPHVRVYGPLDDDLAAHMQRIAAFNQRAERPTAWTTEVYAASEWRARFRRDRPGNVAVISGRNRGKIELMTMAVDAGLHVLADKPWIVDAADRPRLDELLAKAVAAKLLVYDVMTERYEITSILLRDVVHDRELFGDIEPGDEERPGVSFESVHYLKKLVAGAPLKRPGWFFDIREQGEALADVGTHLVDQVLWMLFADRPIGAVEIAVADAARWPTPLDRAQFAAVTGLADFPAELDIRGGRLDYVCNNRVIARMRDVCVRFDVLWDFEAPPGGGDTLNATFRGTGAAAFIRQMGGGLPELVVETKNIEALTRRIDAWQVQYPGVRLLDDGRIDIPGRYRTGHEEHFAQVARQFLRYVHDPAAMPAWETPHALAKYFLTTEGVALAKQNVTGSRSKTIAG